MPFSIRYTPVGNTASVSGLSLGAALQTAADLESAGHQDIVVMDEAGEEIGFRELARLAMGNQARNAFPPI